MNYIWKAIIIIALIAFTVVLFKSSSSKWQAVAGGLISLIGVLITLFFPSPTSVTINAEKANTEINAKTVIVQNSSVNLTQPQDNERTSITLQDRNLSNTMENSSWYPTVVANEGDIIRFRVTYKNESSETQNDVLVFVKWSETLEYIPGTTILYNSNYKEGINLKSDGLADETGINIGSYLAGASAVVTYEAKVKNGLGIGTNYLRNWTQIYVNDLTPELGKDFVQDYADVMVIKNQ